MIKYRCLFQGELTFFLRSIASLDRTSIDYSRNLNTYLPYKYLHFRDLNLGAGLCTEFHLLHELLMQYSGQLHAYQENHR